MLSMDQELSRIGSLNLYLKSLEESSFDSDDGIFVYAGTYTRLGIVPVKKGGEWEDVEIIEVILLIHILDKDVPSVTTQVDRSVKEELYTQDESDERFGKPNTWKRKLDFKKTETDDSNNQGEDDEDDATGS